MKELIAELNALNVEENEGLPHDLPEELVARFPGLKKPVATGIDQDEHRWYTMSTSVYQVGEEFMGVRVIDVIKSESTDRSDIGNMIEFFPMKKVMVESFEAITEEEVA